MTSLYAKAFTTFVALFRMITFSGPPLMHSEALVDLPGSAFTQNNGFQAAVDAAPVWFFGRSLRRNPCYPDFATINNGTAPNPGKGKSLGPDGPNPNPGDCRTPGPWNGTYSPGASFPNYINVNYCSEKDEWYVTYSLYYVHDGVFPTGHVNDWESATVVWGRVAQDQWQRRSAILSEHSGHKKYSWADMETADDPTDRDTSRGRNKKHPKVYVGFFKHPNFHDKYTKADSHAYNPALPDKEYRSYDWYFLPQLSDMHASTEIRNDWDYGKASSSPGKITPCTFDLIKPPASSFSAVQ